MRGLLQIIQSNYFKLSLLAVSFVVFCYIVHSHESLPSKARRLSFPGVTQLNLNYNIKKLVLEKLDQNINADLLKNLNDRKLEAVSSLFLDRKYDLKLLIAETTDHQLVLAVIKNNQVTQIQKINDITNKTITLQYGIISLNTREALADNAAIQNTL